LSNTFNYDSPLVYDSDQAYNAYAPSSTPNAAATLAHLSAQVALGSDGTFDFLIQDSISEITQCVEMIVGTTIGDRTVVPTFGIPDQTFTQPNKGQIETAISLWEPRCLSNVTIRTNNQNVSNISVDVALAKKGVGTQ
jgi:phage baseplate assembly protein W